MLFIFIATLNASVIDFTKNTQTLLQESDLYIDKENLNFEQIQSDVVFEKSLAEHINLGFVKDTALWVRLTFYNNQNISAKKILEIQNPLLESLILYDGNKTIKQGMLHLDETHRSINPIFELGLKPHETKTYYIKIENSTTALRLGIALEDEMIFIHEDHHQQLLIFIFFSIIMMLFLYNFILFIYTKERAYFYYCLYLLTLIFQQATYLGISQIYLPTWFVYYDNLSVVLKVNIMYITAAIFAKSFLLTQEYSRINKIYNFIIIAALIEIPLFGMPQFYYPEIAILTGFVFVLFNISAGIYIYKQGYTQARFFVVGWIFLAIGFALMILDGLGFISVMQDLSDLILFLTAVEAFALSLAFTDRYIILKLQKEKSDAILVDTLKERQRVIEFEIQKQTQDLHTALGNEKTLFKELHHRTKNNLQLILSLVRMQAGDTNEDVQDSFKDLEYRINAIAKTHQMLYAKDNLQEIDMREYIEELCNELENLSEKEVVILSDIHSVYMPLREASYIGLIINELVTNAIKHVNKERVQIEVKLLKIQEIFKLEIKDNGDGLMQTKNENGIGMKLLKTLVEEQLEGTLRIDGEGYLHYMIEFKL